MNDDNEYANLLEMYANIIRKVDYRLSREQKEIIKNLGKTFCDRLEKNPIEIEEKENTKIYSKKIITNSDFKKMREKQKEYVTDKLNMKLAKDIGKEPGE